MESSTIIVVGVVLALLAALSFILMQVSSKEYPTKEEEEYVRPKFQPRKVTDLSTSEPPKRKKKRYYTRRRNQLVQMMHKLRKDLLEDLKNLTNGLVVSRLGA